MNEHLEWGKVNYLQVFEARVKPIIAGYENEILMGEYQILQRIFAVDDIEDSMLIEYIDILDECVKDECTKRWIRSEEVIDKRNSEVILGRFPAVVG